MWYVIYIYIYMIYIWYIYMIYIYTWYIYIWYIYIYIWYHPYNLFLLEVWWVITSRKHFAHSWPLKMRTCAGGGFTTPDRSLGPAPPKQLQQPQDANTAKTRAWTAQAFSNRRATLKMSELRSDLIDIKMFHVFYYWGWSKLLIFLGTRSKGPCYLQSRGVSMQ